MDKNKTIIIILLVIIIVLVAVIGFTVLNPTNAKEPTKVKITSDKTQYEDKGKLSIQLTDLNKTQISKEIVNITITNKKGKVVVDDVVKTNSKGKANLDLNLKKGKYKVKVSYCGNENYTGNNTTQKLTIKEKVVKAEASQSDNNNDQRPSYYDKIHVEVDPVSGGSITDLSQLSQDEYAQYLGYSDAEEMERETERKRQESYEKYYK